MDLHWIPTGDGKEQQQAPRSSIKRSCFPRRVRRLFILPQNKRFLNHERISQNIRFHSFCRKLRNRIRCGSWFKNRLDCVTIDSTSVDASSSSSLRSVSLSIGFHLAMPLHSKKGESSLSGPSLFAWNFALCSTLFPLYSYWNLIIAWYILFCVATKNWA